MEAPVKLKKQPPFKRGYGILLPIFSLPGDYGIGGFGAKAVEFINFLQRAGASYWQLLPLGPTGYGDSPYQSVSSFAGNPYFIDPETLFRQGKISRQTLENAKQPTGRIDYYSLYKTRPALLFEAFQNSRHQDTPEYQEFLIQNSYWLEDYTRFIVLKKHFSDQARTMLPYRIKSKEATQFAEKNLKEEMAFERFVQFEFYSQWHSIYNLAHQKDLKIIGDLPLYTADDSADVWANPNLFVLDSNQKTAAVAGVPPDDFSADGQLWGNPLYRWPEHEKNGFSWWCKRTAHQFTLFDILRIDHFIGISRYYAIHAKDTNAKAGQWLDGPDRKLIAALQKHLPNGRYIAEDLGILNAKTCALMKASGLPGMRLLQSAFSDPGNKNLPHRHVQNCVLYTGTHDNSTLTGKILQWKQKEKQFAKRYLGVKRQADLAPRLLRACFASVADTVILPLQDLLFLDDRARINTPATLGDNWQWRLENIPSNLLADETAALAQLYDRSNEP